MIQQILVFVWIIFMIVFPVYLIWKYDWLGIFMVVIFNQAFLTVDMILPALLFGRQLTEDDILIFEYMGWMTSGSYSLMIWVVKHLVLFWKRYRDR